MPDETTPYQDFEVDAYETLKNAPDYNTGVNELIEKYKSSKFDYPEEAQQILTDYATDLRHRFKEPTPDIEETVAIAPYKINSTLPTKIDQINDWEKQNTSHYTSTSDPDELAVKDAMLRNIADYSSEARRDEHSGTGGAWDWATDKFFRMGEGAVGPLAKLVGLDELDKALYERTERKRDADLTSHLASGVGMVAPLVGTGALGLGFKGAAAVIGAQAAGEATDIYHKALAETGEEDRALAGAALTVGAFAVGMVPLGKLAEGLGGALAGSVVKEGTEALVKGAVKEGAEATINDALVAALNAQKKTFGNVAKSTLEAGIAGSAGAVIQNIGNNIALDRDGSITQGAADAFITNAILGGVASGAHALLENAAIEQAKGTFKKATKSEKAIKPPEEEGVVPDDPEEQFFYKGPDNKWTMKDETSYTTEERHKRTEEAAKAWRDYTNEEPVPWEEGATTDTGEKANIPYGEDVEVEGIPDGVTLLPDRSNIESGQQGTLRPGKWAQYWAGKLAAKFSLDRNISDGAFGAYQQSTNTVKILRSLGADPSHFVSTMAHEIGHFVDRKFKQLISRAIPLDVLREHGTELSREWRPGWDGTDATNFGKYRGRPEELYADVFSALVNAPDWVKDNHPGIYKAFEESLTRTPDLADFWKQVQEFNRDPSKITDFNMALSKESRKKEGDIEAAVRRKDIEKNRFQRRMKAHLDLAYETVFNKLSAAKDIARSFEGEKREEAFRNLDNLERTFYSHDFVNREISSPLKTLLGKFLQEEGLDMNTWAQHLWATKLTKESTPTIERIKNNPELYAGAARFIGTSLAKEKGVKPSVLTDIFGRHKTWTPEELIKAFSKIGIIGDTAQVLDLKDFLAKYPLLHPRREALARRDLTLAAAHLNRRKLSIPVDNLIKQIERASTDPNKLDYIPEELKEALKDVMHPGAFAIRRLLVNEGATTVFDAERDLQSIKQKLGPKLYSKLEEYSDNFHSLMSRGSKVIKESGMWSPELLQRVELNKDNYVTANVLKYFEGNDNVSSGVRSAIGSLSETGNELTSTYMKTRAIIEHAYRQRGVNSAINLAKADGKVVEVTPGRKGFDIYAEKDRLSRSDKEHSYLIGMHEGKASLYKIEGGKSWERMFNSVRDAPGWSMVADLADTFNSAFITRQLKTVLSPVFAVFQKHYDRKLEAIMANSLEVTLGLPIHTSGKLRGIDKETIAELRHYKKTGELTGGLKTLVDRDGVLLHLSTAVAEGHNTDMSVEDAIYENFGTKMPDANTRLEKLGIFTEKSLEKLGGKFFKDVAEFDEIRTKVNGFKIGKMRGMSDAEATVFARENFGVPDPKSGGTAAPLINRLFLFGRAHLNGLRVLGHLGRDLPKTAAVQIAARVIAPKAMVIGPLMAAVLKASVGQEEADKYQLLLDMIPEFEKMSKNIIPLGFQDGQGNYYNFFDVKPSDIQSDWKAWYVRQPQAREVTSIAKVLWPFIKNIGQGEISKAVTESAKGAINVGMASVQPPVQYLGNLAQIFTGSNPTDIYRMKGIFNDSLQEAGSLPEKLGAYGQYVLGQQYSTLVPYNPYKTSEAQGTGEKLSTLPLVGPMMRSFMGISNYGLIEKNKAREADKNAVDASIMLSTGEGTKTLLSSYREAAGKISSLGKGWQTEVGPDVAEKMRALTTWHARIWVPYKNEIRAALESGDAERYEYLLKELEDSSKDVLPDVKQMNSALKRQEEAPASK